MSSNSERVDGAIPPRIDNPIPFKTTCSNSQVLANGTDSGKPDINVLRSRIKYLEQQLNEKEAENQRLRAEIAQHRAREHLCRKPCFPRHCSCPATIVCVSDLLKTLELAQFFAA